MERESVLPIHQQYGFPPSLAPIKPFWDAGGRLDEFGINADQHGDMMLTTMCSTAITKR